MIRMRAITPTCRVYDVEDLPEILADLQQAHMLRIVKNQYKQQYYNVPCSFDIETTSFYIDKSGQCIDETERNRRREIKATYNPKKYATMYVWQFAIYDYVIMGRTWDEWLRLLDQLHLLLNTGKKRRLIIYVHNLAFELQMMRKWIKWYKIFADSPRTPIYAITDTGIEFRCSYKLSGYSLAKVAENLLHHDIRKLKGDLDYKLLRTSITPLTEEEIGYCVNDVLIVTAYIEELIQQAGKNITRIPLTQTGFARNHCREKCLTNTKENPYQYYDYRELMDELTVDPDEFKQMVRAFQGGFTHACAEKVSFEYEGGYIEKIQHNVYGIDFASAYPASIVLEKFPMGCGEEIDVNGMDEKRFMKILRLYCCVFDVILYDVEATFTADHYISRSRCSYVEGVTVDNGRIVNAKELRMTVTEQDWFIMLKTYRWDKSRTRIAHFRRYTKGYLPTEFIGATLELYAAKTSLKGVIGKAEEYMHAKQLLNALFGMMVTNPVHDIYGYDVEHNRWLPREVPDLEKALNKYNKNRGRFTFYLWGVYVTAYCRRNLWATILNMGGDHIYSDTDSEKYIHHELHHDYIQKYNDMIMRKIRKSAEYHHLPIEMYMPKTPKGEEKPIGVWAFDMAAIRFKTVGAKRYLYQDRDGLHLTVAGLGKDAVKYLIKEAGGYTGHPVVDDMVTQRVFRLFREDLVVPPEYTGKLTHTHVDVEMEGDLTDYLGNVGHWHELSAIHMEGATYDMSMDLFLIYLTSLLARGGE